MTDKNRISGPLVDWVPLKNLGDDRGGLVVLESQQTPFVYERLYYIFGTDILATRGHHAHKALRQLAVCVHGSCVMTLDDGTSKQDASLDSPLAALLIEPMIWHSMKEFSSDCVLLVVASAPYDEADYIRSYEDFLALALHNQSH